jgi:hypothetical protein
MGVVTGVKDYPARLTKDLRRDSLRLSKLRKRLSDVRSRLFSIFLMESLTDTNPEFDPVGN